MPLISQSTYRPPFYLFNKHLETIVPSRFRSISDVHYTRERIDLWDGDFLDLDWITQEHKRLVVISHGLEGSSDRHYIKGMAKHFQGANWDVLAWNCRSCSGEMNRTPKLYHHGSSEDLDAVLEHVFLHHRSYTQIALVGFSLGGSITLRYLGQQGEQINPRIKTAAVFSVPCNLPSSIPTLHASDNHWYKKYFLQKLSRKIREKAPLFPDMIDLKGLDAISDLNTFATRYTAPLHGFDDAKSFYQAISPHPFMEGIRIPTLLVNAENDPLLPKACYPIDLARQHEHLFLEIPQRGGHVGFSRYKNEPNWAEQRALEFVSLQIGEELNTQ